MNKDKKIIKRWLSFFITALVISGLTAIPAEQETALLSRLFPANTSFGRWMLDVYNGIATTNEDFPFIAYGYDWLAFAHFVLAILFIGPLTDPVKNKWIVEFGILACLLIIPYALIAGHFRSIPVPWRLIDCSFGLFGLLPLLICRKKIIHLEEKITQTANHEN